MKDDSFQIVYTAWVDEIVRDFANSPDAAQGETAGPHHPPMAESDRRPASLPTSVVDRPKP